jgi:hypothetical protein
MLLIPYSPGPQEPAQQANNLLLKSDKSAGQTGSEAATPQVSSRS